MQSIDKLSEAPDALWPKLHWVPILILLPAGELLSLRWDPNGPYAQVFAW